MVDSEMDCTTPSYVISSQESVVWSGILDMLRCKDMWGYIGGHTLRYTYHSRSHKKAMSRLDRCYYSHVYELSAASKMWVDATVLLSDHNPLLVSLREVGWNLCTPFSLPRIPLRINHSWMQTLPFKSKVQSLIQHVLLLKVSACMKWEFLVTKLREVIRDCGKTFSRILNSTKFEAQHLISLLSEKVDSGQQLSEEEYAHLCKAHKCLEVIENQAIQSSKVRARCTEVNDWHANSKCFFDYLRVKRLKDVISHLGVDGSAINDGNPIATFCSQHFRKLFAASYKSDDAWFQALHESLRHTPRLLDAQMADACEKSMSEEEVFMALKSLKNGKAPGLDGIKKEFVMAFWPLLKNLVLDVCNEIWKDQKMPYTFKLGKIKLIPKLEVPRCIGDWRPITMMGIIYKIFAKVFALTLKHIIHKVVHPSQVGFIHQRSIYDNIFLIQILMEHTASSDQEAIGMQIDFEKAFDLIRLDFIAIVLKKLGFGTRFSRLIYILAQGSASHRSVRQGCPLSPLFYALASSPMFYLLEAKMKSQCIYGISLYGTQQIAINMKKSAIVNISEQQFQSLKWEGPRFEKGIIFRHLGYPLAWVLCRVKCKMEKWNAAQWPLHVRIKIVQTFLQSYIMYYLLLMDWKKSQLQAFDRLLKNFLWNKKHSRALVLSSWQYVCQPRDKGGLGFLNLHLHLIARRAAFVMRITSSYKPLWTPIFGTSSHTINFLLNHFKTALSTLKWNGRQRYVGNSLSSISPYWSFLTNPPFAYSLVISLLQQYQIPLSIDASDPWRDWLLAKHTRWWVGESSIYYRALLTSDTIAYQNSWWHTRYALLWGSPFTYKMKIFMWKIFVGHFTLGAFLSKHGFKGVRCPHCASYAENMRHAFWSCPHIQRWWNTLFLFPIWSTKPTKFDTTFLLFDCTNTAVNWIKGRCISLLRNIWMLRNFKMFKTKMQTPAFSWQYCKAQLRLDIMGMAPTEKIQIEALLNEI
ncbi:hypothetical protein KP509_1Z068400 [Ceratopteris richardii]|nr:hypothetical protein KP509_1Z068400 [Ceratopteris richardii]